MHGSNLGSLKRSKQTVQVRSCIGISLLAFDVVVGDTLLGGGGRAVVPEAIAFNKLSQLHK